MVKGGSFQKPSQDFELANQHFPISSIVLWGGLGSGKTLAALSTPVKPAVIIDAERGSRIYFEQQKQLNAIGIDLSDIERVECLTRDEFFKYMLKFKEQYTPENKLGTLIIDPYSLVEDWFNEWFFKKPDIQQLLDKQKGLAWGAFKSTMKGVLLQWMNVCELLILTSHARKEFVGGAPSGGKEPKCGEVPLETSDLVIMLRRTQGKQIPDGLIVQDKGKSRIIGLPEFIPDFSIKRLEDFIRNPREWSEYQAPPEENILEKITKTITATEEE